ncbi:MAG: GxxExxY protein [Bacteroidota bacterium]
MITEEYKYKEITGRIIGAAMRVHKELGNGFQEVIYQRALELELPFFDLKFEREYEMPIYYRNQQIGSRRVDFLVEELVSVELKAIIKLEDVHLAQAINYLEAYNIEVGLLINFGSKSIEIKRLVNTKFVLRNPLI